MLYWNQLTCSCTKQRKVFFNELAAKCNGRDAAPELNDSMVVWLDNISIDGSTMIIPPTAMRASTHIRNHKSSNSGLAANGQEIGDGQDYSIARRCSIAILQHVVAASSKDFTCVLNYTSCWYGPNVYHVSLPDYCGCCPMVPPFSIAYHGLTIAAF